MKCPGCSAEVADGTSICPSCDYIIDDSFLGGAPASAPGGPGDTPNPGIKRPSPPPTRSGKKRKTPKRKPKTANGSAKGEDVGPAPPPPLAPTMPTRFAPEAPAARAPSSYSPVFRPEEVMDDARLFLGGLTTADKLTLVGGALMVLCSFFPWKETAAEGEVIGLQSLGIVATGLMALALATVVARARRSVHVNPALGWLVQLGSTGAAAVWCLVFIKLSWDPTEAHAVDGNMLVPVSKPALGAYLGVVSGVLASAGTLLGLKDGAR